MQEQQLTNVARVRIDPPAIIQNDRERISYVTGAEASFSWESGGSRLRIRIPRMRLDFSVAASTATIEYEWREEAPKADATPDADRGVPPSPKPPQGAQQTGRR